MTDSQKNRLFEQLDLYERQFPDEASPLLEFYDRPMKEILVKLETRNGGRLEWQSIGKAEDRQKIISVNG